MSLKSLTKTLPLQFNTKQLNRLRKHCATNGIEFNQDKLSEVYSFWMENISTATHYERDFQLANQSVTINKTLLDVAPDLLFIDVDLMKKRLEKFSQFGFINNLDRFFIFRESPYGWFLQDWEQFTKKYSYIQFRIMPWLMEREDDPFPEPHPLVRACQVLELPYNQIKSRFLWISSAGVKPPKLNGDHGDRLIYHKVLQNCLLSDSSYFVNQTTPGVRKSEYEFFEKIIGQTEMIEDSIMSSIGDLTRREAKNLIHDHEDENIRQLASVEYKKIRY